MFWNFTYQLTQYILKRYTIQLVYNGLRFPGLSSRIYSWKPRRKVLHYEQEHVKLAETFWTHNNEKYVRMGNGSTKLLPGVAQFLTQSDASDSTLMCGSLPCSLCPHTMRNNVPAEKLLGLIVVARYCFKKNTGWGRLRTPLDFSSYSRPSYMPQQFGSGSHLQLRNGNRLLTGAGVVITSFGRNNQIWLTSFSSSFDHDRFSNTPPCPSSDYEDRWWG